MGSEADHQSQPYFKENMCMPTHNMRKQRKKVEISPTSLDPTAAVNDILVTFVYTCEFTYLIKVKQLASCPEQNK